MIWSLEAIYIADVSIELQKAQKTAPSHPQAEKNLKQFFT